MANHLQKKAIKVSGHLEEKRGIYQMILTWIDSEEKRQRQSKSTGLKAKGNKKRAEDMLHAARKEKEQELASMPELGDPLFADFMEFVWLDVIRQEVKLTTFGGYQMNVQKAIAPWFRAKGIHLRNLTAEDINEFYDDCLEHMKAASVLKFHANIGKALKYAVKKGLIEHSVMEKVDRPKPERFVGKFLKQSEVVALFEAVKGNKLELGVILGAFYGLRRAEVVGLKWDAIDFEANTISIEHTVTTATIDGKRILIADDTTKTKSSFRTLPLVPSFRAKLLAVKEEQDYYRKLCRKGYNKKHNQYIYTDQLGNRILPQYLTEAFPKFMERNGFRRMRFHDLRHPYVKPKTKNILSICYFKANAEYIFIISANKGFYQGHETKAISSWQAGHLCYKCENGDLPPERESLFLLVGVFVPKPLEQHFAILATHRKRRLL